MAYTNKYRLWAIGDTSDLPLFLSYGVHGFQISLNWADVSTAEGEYDWSALDTQVNDLIDNDLYIGFIFTVGQNSPQWVLDAVGTFTTHGSGEDGPYPKYYNPDYIALYYQFLSDVADHVHEYGSTVQTKFVYWQIAEGTTGDTGAYHGTIDAPYVGDPYVPQDANDATWQSFRQDAWAAVTGYNAQNPWLNLLINTGNNGENLDYVQSTYPAYMTKSGVLSHEYGFNGEALVYARNTIDRGEAQQFWQTPEWQAAPLNQSFALVCSALTGQLDILNTPTGWYVQNTSDPRPTDFFNKYAGTLSVTNATKGFCQLRDVPDFSDLSRFPEDATWHELIDPSRLGPGPNTYLTTVANIMSAGFEPTYEAWLLNEAIVDYLNPARVTAITAAFPDADYDPTDEYHNDFGVGMAGNYGMYLTQFDPLNTSDGVWRAGVSTDLYGRYAKQFLISGGSGAIYLKVDPGLASPDTTRLTISVTYLDQGTGRWAIRYFNAGDTLVPKRYIQNNDTGEWLTTEVTICSFNFQTDYDIVLSYESGDNTIFSLIEVENILKIV